MARKKAAKTRIVALTGGGIRKKKAAKAPAYRPNESGTSGRGPVAKKAKKKATTGPLERSAGTSGREKKT